MTHVDLLRLAESAKVGEIATELVRTHRFCKPDSIHYEYTESVDDCLIRVVKDWETARRILGNQATENKHEIFTGTRSIPDAFWVDLGLKWKP